jgi:hypothetical protein
MSFDELLFGRVRKPPRDVHRGGSLRDPLFRNQLPWDATPEEVLAAVQRATGWPPERKPKRRKATRTATKRKEADAKRAQ